MVMLEFSSNQLKALHWSSDVNLFKSLPIATWLLDEQSLTAKLKQQYADFSVQLLSQQIAVPNDNEIKLFQSLPSITRQTYTIRQVLLMGHGEPQVYARSVIPNISQANFLLTLGNKPLGEVLFNHPDTIRNTLEFAQTSGNIWGRRSMFVLEGFELLVYEFFIAQEYVN